MTDSGTDKGRETTIAYELSSGGNARLLEQVLVDRYQLHHGLGVRDAGDAATSFDIAIVDPGSLERSRPRLRAYREQSSPVVLPVLLLASGDQEPAAWIRRELGRTVDDVLRIPTTEAELTARIDNMLRLRELSRLQEATYRETQRQASEIRSLAYSDTLTGLPNRKYFLDRLDERLEQSEQTGVKGAVLFIDLNLFKMVNDALGHQAGDDVLRWVGRRLRRLVRDSDLVARHGGDEFVLAMFDEPRGGRDYDPEAFEAAVHDMATRVLQQLREPIMLGEYEHRLGASIGVSLFPEHGVGAGLLVERADTAMYEAKKGRHEHICLFSEEILERRQHRLSLEARLYQAINRDELTLHYQPVLRLDTFEVIDVEALVRWPQPDGSLMPPSEFLPVAEETGMIAQLGEWVLTAAARQLREWRDAGHAFGMMINLSMRQLHSGYDVEHFAGVVRSHVDPASIELEVTESALMSDPPVVEAKLAALHEQGFRLAIDDFGTGYSSLSRIQDLPFQTLKIDRMFVAGIGRRGKGETVTQTILQLAENLSLRAVAEGIESEAQHQFLLREGCGFGQGFLFSPALPPDRLEDFLRGADVG